MNRFHFKRGLCLLASVCILVLSGSSPASSQGLDDIEKLKDQVETGQKYREILKDYQLKVESGECYLFQPRRYVYVVYAAGLADYIWAVWGGLFDYGVTKENFEEETRKNLLELKTDLKKLDKKILELKQRIAELESAREDRGPTERSGGKLIEWRMMPGYPKKNPKNIDWSKKWKFLTVTIDPGSITTRDLRKHGLTGAITVDWTFNFSFAGYDKKNLKPGESVRTDINGSMTIAKNEKLFLGETVKVSWVGFEITDSSPKEPGKKLYELDGVILNKNQRSGSRHLEFRVPKDTSQFENLEMSIVIGGRGVAWLCKWEPVYKD